MPPPSESTPLKDGASAGGYTVCGCLHIRRRDTALLLTMALIFYAIAIKEATNIAGPAALPALEAHHVGGPDSHLVTYLPGMTTVAYALGKASQPILTHYLGGRNVLAYVLGLFGGLCCLLVVTADRPSFILAGMGGISFAMAHAWGAAIYVSANWVRVREVGRVFALAFGFAGSGGSALFAFFYGLILDAPPEGTHWRGIFLLSGACLLVAAGLCFALLRDSASLAGFPPSSAAGQVDPLEAPHPLDGASLASACRAFLRSLRCHLMIIVCCGYSVASGVINSYAPLYAVNQLGASQGDAARLLMWNSLGCCFGSATMGLVRDYCPPRYAYVAVVSLTGGLNLLGAAGVVLWAGAETAYALAQWSTTETLDAAAAEAAQAVAAAHAAAAPWLTISSLYVIVFLVAASIDATWTVNVSVFQMRYGGHAHASTFTGLADVVSFAAKTPFMFVAGAFFERRSYGVPLAIIMGSVLAAHAAIMLFFALDGCCGLSERPAPEDAVAPFGERSGRGSGRASKSKPAPAADRAGPPKRTYIA